MTELEKLKARLSGVINFRVSWGEDALAGKYSQEELAAQLNRVLDAIGAEDYEDVTNLDE